MSSKGKAMTRYPRLALYSIGLFGFFLVVTNPHHYLFYSRYLFWGDDFGKLFYVHVVINYLLILI
ncbi:histidine kinase N-terminal 7TM domain-containing protein, partial [Vallitalea sediminicola]